MLSLKRLMFEAGLLEDDEVLAEKLIRSINIQYPNTIKKYLGQSLSRDVLLNPSIFQKLMEKLLLATKSNQDVLNNIIPNPHNLQMLMSDLEIARNKLVNEPDWN